jgi:hypothetical protein
MRAIKLLVASVTSLACLAGLAACAESSSPTRAAFVSKADAVCKKFNNESGKLTATLTAKSTDADFAKLVKEQLVPLFKKQLSEIRTLGFPAADKAQLDKLLNDSDKLADQIYADPIKFVNSATDPFADINNALAAYGMTECGNSTTATTAAGPSTT